MRKILAFILAVMLMCAMPIVAFAEDGSADAVEETEAVVDDKPATEENTSEGEISGEEESFEISPETIVAYAKQNIEEISVIVTLLLTVIYQVRKHRVLNKSIGMLNNNAVNVTEKALSEMGGMSSVVTGYKDEIAVLLGEYRQTAEDKKRLQASLAEVEGYLKTAKLANVEFANELAELLVLANIPNSKKEELYSRHRAAVDSISVAEVNDNDGQEA